MGLEKVKCEEMWAIIVSVLSLDNSWMMLCMLLEIIPKCKVFGFDCLASSLDKIFLSSFYNLDEMEFIEWFDKRF